MHVWLMLRHCSPLTHSSCTLQQVIKSLLCMVPLLRVPHSCKLTNPLSSHSPPVPRENDLGGRTAIYSHLQLQCQPSAWPARANLINCTVRPAFPQPLPFMPHFMNLGRIVTRRRTTRRIDHQLPAQPVFQLLEGSGSMWIDTETGQAWALGLVKDHATG